MSFLEKNIPDNKRTYEKTIPLIDSILGNLGFQMSEKTKSELSIALRMAGYFDHQYDKKQGIEKENLKKLFFDKFKDKELVNVGDMDETTNQLIDILNDKGIQDEFIYYIKKAILYGDKGSETEDCDLFIKYKYYEGYVTAKLVSSFLKCDENSEKFSNEIDRLLCDIVGTSNLLDDFLDLKFDYEHGISKLKPTFKNELKLLGSVISNSYTRILRSGQFNMKILSNILKCIPFYVIKNFRTKGK